MAWAHNQSGNTQKRTEVVVGHSALGLILEAGAGVDVHPARSQALVDDGELDGGGGDGAVVDPEVGGLLVAGDDDGGGGILHKG